MMEKEIKINWVKSEPRPPKEVKINWVKSEPRPPKEVKINWVKSEPRPPKEVKITNHRTGEPSVPQVLKVNVVDDANDDNATSNNNDVEFDGER